MKVLIVSATQFEILPLLDHLRNNFKNKDNIRFFSKELDINILVTGVGVVHTTFALTTFLIKKSFDLVINLGIAGAFNKNFNLGQVFQVVRDQFADIGVEDSDGSFSDIFEIELHDNNEFPYINSKLYSPNSNNKFLPQATAITVNKVHGTIETISKIQKKYSIDLETMEGAAFLYCCLMQQVNCIQIRAVSNYVEPRNKENWDIPLAIENLNDVAIQMIGELGSK
ncbi:MAG: futalosine hydrolase [Saprospiraceae bacterium]|nr:futalosine hydrolase [Saprospiraceae bacterium]